MNWVLVLFAIIVSLVIGLTILGFIVLAIAMFLAWT